MSGFSSGKAYAAMTDSSPIPRWRICPASLGPEGRQILRTGAPRWASGAPPEGAILDASLGMARRPPERLTRRIVNLVNVPRAPSPRSANAVPSLPASAVDAGLGLLCLIRSELRERRPAGLSIGQFRLLHMIHRDAERSLSDFADDLGVSVPAASKMVDGLVERGFVGRTADATDRRKLSLVLTQGGVVVMKEAKKGLEARMAEALAGLPPTEAAALAKALETLRQLLERVEVTA